MAVEEREEDQDRGAMVDTAVAVAVVVSLMDLVAMALEEAEAVERLETSTLLLLLAFLVKVVVEPSYCALDCFSLRALSLPPIKRYQAMLQCRVQVEQFILTQTL